MTPEIANVVSEYLDDINGDQVDKVIAATSILHRAKLLTADENLKSLKFLDTV